MKLHLGVPAADVPVGFGATSQMISLKPLPNPSRPFASTECLP